MADQVNLMDASIQTTNDPTNGYQYIVIEGVDYRIATSDLYKNIMRSKTDAECDGTASQFISYSSPFLALPPIIVDYQGCGIEVVSFTEAGFTIKSLSSGNFAYYTLLEV